MHDLVREIHQASRARLLSGAPHHHRPGLDAPGGDEPRAHVGVGVDEGLHLRRATGPEEQQRAGRIAQGTGHEELPLGAPALGEREVLGPVGRAALEMVGDDFVAEREVHARVP